MKPRICYAYWMLLFVSIISSCVLFILVASETVHTNKKKNGIQNEFIKDEEISQYEYIHLDKQELKNYKDKVKPIEFRKRKTKIHKSEENYDSNSPETSNLNDLIFLGSVSKNSGAIIPDITAAPSFITLEETNTDIKIENKLEDNLDLLLNNITMEDDVLNYNISSYNNESSNENLILNLTEPHFRISENVKINDPVKHVHLSSSDLQYDQSQTIKLNEILNASDQLDSTNLTVDEKPIPVFSEWAQKQMEEAEKQLEKDTVNTSAMKKNNSKPSGYKTQVLKLRAKNYASPDCGAKILSANPEAQSTSSVLTSHKDEYLLNPCTSKIWFVVELCEPIQAENIELANFELFSSSPKDFSVSVSNRFPTRDWSNVGQFTANDERDVQSFNLNPHLFGKFLRVDINSHYNSEHYCPISLFRVYGTSEFEAFETENQLSSASVIDNDYDEDIDEIVYNTGENNKNGNILKTAGEAVMNMVKKAAEVLAKTNDNIEMNIDKNEFMDYDDNNNNIKNNKIEKNSLCVTPFYLIKCDNCSYKSISNINNLVSCKYNILNNLINLESIKNNLIKSHYCANILGLNSNNEVFFNYSNIYIIHLLSKDYLGALCNILAYTMYKHVLTINSLSTNITTETVESKEEFNPFNFSIEENRMNIDINFNKVNPNKLKHDELKYDNGKENIIVNKYNINTKILTGTNQQIENVELSDEELNPTNFNENIENVELNINLSDFMSEKDMKKTTVNIIGVPPENNNDDVNIYNSVNKVVNDESNLKEIINDINKNTDSSNIITSEVVDSKADSWDNYESLILNEQQQIIEQNSKNLLPQQQSPGNNQPAIQKVQPESVFLRLSNRIKALERNMSLSGQYLEELSKRYKKQVEELKQSFAKTLISIEEQNKRNFEREKLLTEQNIKFQQDINELMDLVYNWRSIVLYIGGFIITQFLFIYFLLKIFMHKKPVTKEQEFEPITTTSRFNKLNPKLLRRNSIEGEIGHSNLSPTTRRRRPSEEALNISGTYEDLLIFDDEEKDEMKQRKSMVSLQKPNRRSNSVEPINKTNKYELMRTESAPGNFHPNIKESSKSIINNSIEEQPYLEDNVEFIIPTASDLSYDEFLRDSVHNNLSTSSVANNNNNTTYKISKTRRLSSPAFLKSALNKNVSFKKSDKSQSKRNDETTSWEWYRLKKSPSQKKILNNITNISNNQVNGIGINSESNSDISSVNAVSTNFRNSERKSGGSFRRIFKKVF